MLTVTLRRQTTQRPMRLSYRELRSGRSFTPIKFGSGSIPAGEELDLPLPVYRLELLEPLPSTEVRPDPAVLDLAHARLRQPDEFPQPRLSQRHFVPQPPEPPSYFP
jgi:hypothetical protein